MKNDFDSWNILKQDINEKLTEVYFKEREIWFCSIGRNIGHEQHGHHDLFERPVFILKKFDKGSFFGVPISSKLKTGTWYASIKYKDAMFTLLLNQARLFDSKRLTRKVTQLSHEEHHYIKDQFRKLI